MNKKRVSAELKSTPSGFKKAIEIKKSGGDIVVLTFFDFSNDLWGSYPAVTSIQNSIDSSRPLWIDDSDSFSPVDSSSIIDIADAKDLSNENKSNELSNE